MDQVAKVELYESEAHFPDNLTEWLDGQQLHEWIAEAVTEMAGVRADRLGDGFPRPDDVMLHLLVCSYATGVYESGEIAGNCLGKERSELSGGKISPGSQEIRRFRRTRRAEVEQCLSKVLEQAWEYKFGFRQATESTDPNRTVNGPNLYEALFPFAAEAQSRVRKAICYDSWAWDW